MSDRLPRMQRKVIPPTRAQFSEAGGCEMTGEFGYLALKSRSS